MDLLNAIEDKNLSKAIALIDAKADINIQDRYGTTPLIGACMMELPGVALALIDAGADLNLKFDGRTTALFYACLKKLSRVALTLIAAGADLNVQDVRWGTALTLAWIVNWKNDMTEVILALITSDNLVYIPMYSRLTGDINVQKALSFNFSQYPLRYEFTLADIHLLNSRNFNKVKTLMLIRNRTDSLLHIFSMKLMQLLFVNMFW